jgi:hypothetical protein
VRRRRLAKVTAADLASVVMAHCRSSSSVSRLDTIAHLPVGETIPCIFRIMDSSAVIARTLQGMTRVRPGQAPGRWE